MVSVKTGFDCTCRLIYKQQSLFGAKTCTGMTNTERIIGPDIFCNTRGLENWGISSDVPQFWLRNIRSRDKLRPIAREQKYLMDYK